MRLLPWHHRWNVLAMTVLSQTIVVGLQYCFPFWVVPWAEEFHVAHSQLLLIVSLSAVVLSLASPFAGVVFDRYPTKRLYGVGVIMVCLLYFAVSFATSYWVILVCIGLLLPTGMVLTTNLFSQIMIGRWFTSQRGLAMGISSLGVALGAFAFPPIATTLLTYFDWHMTFRILAFSALVILMPSGLLAFSRNPDTPETRVSQESTDELTTFALLRNRDFWLIATGFGFLLLACTAVQFGIGSYAKDLGISQQHAAYAASLGAASLACGKLAFGKLTDIVSHRLCYWIAVVLAFLGIGIFSSAHSLPTLTLGMMLVAFGQGCMMPGSVAMVISCFGVQSLGRVLGLMWMFIGMGAFSPYLAGLARDALGSYSMAFPLLTVPLLFTAIAMRRIPDRDFRETRTLATPSK